MSLAVKLYLNSPIFVGTQTVKENSNSDAESQLYGAFRHEESEEYDKAANIYQRLVHCANNSIATKARYRLGLMCAKGLGIAQDERLAFEHMKFAADNNDVCAQYQVGLMYKYGRGVDVNEAQAKNYLSQAAEVGYEEARRELSEANSSNAFQPAPLQETSRPVLNGHDGPIPSNHTVKSTHSGLINTPHQVSEKTYKILQHNELHQRIIVPGVSGCAAIKCSVMLDGKLSQSITLHSDGTEASKRHAKEVTNAVKELPGAKKSVSILMITNGFNRTPPTVHYEVVGIMEEILRKEKIPYKSEFRRLMHGAQRIIDIDVSGTNDEIHLRYQHHYQREMKSEELAIRQRQLRAYQNIREEVIYEGMDKARKRGGGIKGTTLVRNPYYLPYIPPAEWGALSTEEQAEKINQTTAMLEKYKEAKGGVLSGLKKVCVNFLRSIL